MDEKILTSRSALEGERKQITLLFADPQGPIVRRWEQSEAGQGQLVLISGEAGISKSALKGIPRCHDERTVHIRPHITPFQIGIHTGKWTRHSPHLHWLGLALLFLE